MVGVDYEHWFGIMGPAGLPKANTDKPAAAIAQVLQIPDARDKLEGDTARWSKLAKEQDIKPLDGDEKKPALMKSGLLMCRIRR